MSSMGIYGSQIPPDVVQAAPSHNSGLRKQQHWNMLCHGQ